MKKANNPQVPCKFRPGYPTMFSLYHRSYPYSSHSLLDERPSAPPIAEMRRPLLVHYDYEHPVLSALPAFPQAARAGAAPETGWHRAFAFAGTWTR